jgi:alkylation response protein AidB-like acyl-CoA dehydrogenase
MVQHIADKRDIDFVIWEQMNAEEILKFDIYQEFNRKTCDMVISEARSLGERNDIVCTGAEEKMGIHASATCSMSLGSRGKCIGFLMGQEREGIKIMFHMMNGARMGTGLQALAYASSAYLLAVNYARERIQGRDLMDFKNLDAPPVTIINHPDVRRNLLWMKS